MRPIQFAVRIAALISLFVLPFALTGLLWSGKGGAFGALLGFLCAIFYLSGSERKWIHRYAAVSISDEAGTLSKKVRERLRVFADPFPQVIVVRALFGRGIILMSQGMMASLQDQELDEMLELCELRLKQRGLPLVSAIGLLCERFTRKIPDGWARWLAGEKTQGQILNEVRTRDAIRFLLLTPFVRFCVWQQRPAFWFLPRDFKGRSLLAGLFSGRISGLMPRLSSLSSTGLVLHMDSP